MSNFILIHCPNLGTFVEVEAIDNTGEMNIEKSKQQCSKYVRLFEIKDEDYVQFSYSDLIVEQTETYI